MIRNLTAILLVLMIDCFPIYPQDSLYRISRFVTGSGGILFAHSNQFLQPATAGETVTGIAQTQNYILKSGFWSYSPLNPSRIKNSDVTVIPEKFSLFQNFPNPFNPSTTIKYGLSEISVVRLEIFNILGERICILINSELKKAGYHYISWSGRNDNGNAVSSGVYFYRLEAIGINSKGRINRNLSKMVLIK